MKIKTHSIFKFLIGVAIIALFPTSVVQAQAVPRLEVIFTPDPLFNELNFLPGDGISGTAEVINNSGETQNVLVEAINIADNEGLGGVLDLAIKEGETTHYYDTLGNFLSVGEVALSELSDGNSTTYTFIVTFGEGIENYQGSALGFDICVGFEDADGIACGNTVISNEGDMDIEDGGEGSGDLGNKIIVKGLGRTRGGGGIINAASLAISNERVAEISINESGTEGFALIEWETNFLSTSQVIYGLASGGPYSINISMPNFGYPYTTEEYFPKTTEHSVFLSGLIPGETYSYRVVSRASPPTVSYEHTFVVAKAPGASGGSTAGAGGIQKEAFGVGGTLDDAIPTGASAEAVKRIAIADTDATDTAGGSNTSNFTKGTLGAMEEAQKTSGSSAQNEVNLEVSENAAAVLFALPDSWDKVFSCALPWLVAVFVVITFILWIINRFVYPITRPFLLYLIGTIFAYIIFAILGKTCVLLALLIAALILLLLILVRGYK